MFHSPSHLSLIAITNTLKGSLNYRKYRASVRNMSNFKWMASFVVRVKSHLHLSGLLCCIWNLWKDGWLFVICVFFSAQRPLLQRLSRRCHGNKYSIVSSPKSVFWNILPSEQSVVSWLSFRAFPPLKAYVLRLFLRRKLKHSHCLPYLLSLGRINFIFRKLAKGIWINDVVLSCGAV